jgi:hypothetical protein
MRRPLTLLLLLCSTALVETQEVSIEYKVKAAFLYNFTKFVEWPPAAQSGPLTICVAGRNPLGSELDETVRDATVGGRLIAVRIILEPEPGCDVVFIPKGVSAAYLRSMRDQPVLTVGESGNFLEQGGIINFYVDSGKVRFTISPDAAARSQLRISARLLQLARIENPRVER